MVAGSVLMQCPITDSGILLALGEPEEGPKSLGGVASESCALRGKRRG